MDSVAFVGVVMVADAVPLLFRTDWLGPDRGEQQRGSPGRGDAPAEQGVQVGDQMRRSTTSSAGSDSQPRHCSSRTRALERTLADSERVLGTDHPDVTKQPRGGLRQGGADGRGDPDVRADPR